MVLGQHLSLSSEWMTPPEVISRVKRVFGGTIDLDPASSFEANKNVGAWQFYSKEQDSLSMDKWSNKPVSIFLNPPGSKRGNVPMPRLFWEKLMFERDSGRIKEAIFLCFSLEQLQVFQQSSGKNISDFCFCVPSKRLKFINGEGANKPSHGNLLVYIDGTENNCNRFVEVFSELGAIFNYQMYI